jgi:hypothetical protein
LLASVMFISEPSRNPRAWLMGLMLLDLLGAEYSPATVTSNRDGTVASIKAAKHFTWQRALVHPSRLDDRAWARETNTGNDQAPEAWVAKQARRDQRIAPSRPLTGDALSTYNRMSQPGSAAVEGLYPPSPKWSGRSDKDRIDVANDYIQTKEVAIVCRWMEQQFDAYVGRPLHVFALSGGPGARRNALTTRFDGESALRGFGGELERLIKTDMIAKRAGSFDSSGMLFK